MAAADPPEYLTRDVFAGCGWASTPLGPATNWTL